MFGVYFSVVDKKFVSVAQLVESLTVNQGDVSSNLTGNAKICRGRAAVARVPHKHQVAGSIPALATRSATVYGKAGAHSISSQVALQAR